MTDHPVPFIVDSRLARALHFNHDSTQSRMRLDDPDALDLAYTRMMMAFLLFVPQPRRISLIGLGGGSLVKYLYRYLPGAALQVAEINPHVIALRHEFQVPADDARLQVHQADGCRFVREPEAACEVLMLDGFGPAGMPEALGSQRFFDDAMMALAPGGVMVLNLHLGDPQLDLMMGRLARSFEGEQALLVVDEEDGANRVVFAWRDGDFSRYRPGLLGAAGQGLGEDFKPVLRALAHAAHVSQARARPRAGAGTPASRREAAV